MLSGYQKAEGISPLGWSQVFIWHHAVSLIFVGTTGSRDVIDGSPSFQQYELLQNDELQVGFVRFLLWRLNTCRYLPTGWFWLRPQRRRQCLLLSG
jgi:hypothetical protein